MCNRHARQVPLRTILVAVAVVVAVYLAGNLLYRLRDVVLLFLVAGFVALVLNPQVVALQRWKVRRRGFAVGIVILWSVLIFAGLAVLFGYPLVNSITHFADALPGYVDKAQHGKGWIGHLVRKYHVQSWVNKNAPKLVNIAQSLGKPALDLGKGAVSVLVELGVTFAVVVLILLEAPKMRVGFLGIVVPRASHPVLGGRWEGEQSDFWLHARQHPHLSCRRAGGLRDARSPLGTLHAPFWALGGPGRLHPDDRRRAGRDTHRAFSRWDIRWRPG